MIVISKKRIQMILTGIMLVVFVFSFHVASNQTNKEQKNTVETTATPLSGKTIIVDARAWNTRETELLINPKNKRGMIEIL